MMWPIAIISFVIIFHPELRSGLAKLGRRPFTTTVSEEDKIDVPDFIVDIVKKCSGMSSGEAPIYIKDSDGNQQFNKQIEEYISTINKKINNLQQTFYQNMTEEHSKEESSGFNQHQRNEWANFMESIALSRYSQEDKLKEMEEFKKLQSQEYLDFWGIDKSKKTKEEIHRFNHEIQELNKQISNYKISKRKEHQSEINQVKIISQIYWDRIVFMIKTLIKNSQPATESTIREALVSVEMITAQETNCVRIIKDEKDNCIVSAIINLLKGIYIFNDELTYSNTILD